MKMAFKLSLIKFLGMKNVTWSKCYYISLIYCQEACTVKRTKDLFHAILEVSYEILLSVEIIVLLQIRFAK